ncbi:MAG: hypothetical protein JOZ41_14855 [Chloroflexi bacterium]|nr:hypothetical protein [Chloroflexota bacterium]
MIAVLAISAALGVTAARTSGPASGQTFAHTLPHRAGGARSRHPVGQWILDDKGGWEYVKYGR